mgnify:CR=1 FL=1
MPIADTAAAMFYNRLFEIDPSLRRMFAATTMEEQGRKLMQMLTSELREAWGKTYWAYAREMQQVDPLAA